MTQQFDSCCLCAGAGPGPDATDHHGETGRAGELRRGVAHKQPILGHIDDQHSVSERHPHERQPDERPATGNNAQLPERDAQFASTRSDHQQPARIGANRPATRLPESVPGRDTELADFPESDVSQQLVPVGSRRHHARPDERHGASEHARAGERHHSERHRGSAGHAEQDQRVVQPGRRDESAEFAASAPWKRRRGEQGLCHAGAGHQGAAE